MSCGAAAPDVDSFEFGVEDLWFRQALWGMVNGSELRIFDEVLLHLRMVARFQLKRKTSLGGPLSSEAGTIGQLKKS